MKKQGLFITFEGTDGVGKSTQMKRAGEWLAGQGYDVVLTREPGGGAVAERIRTILLDPSVAIENLTELFLYQAARVEHVAKTIRPALLSGRIVLCDRFTDSTLAYQGVGRNLMKPARLLNEIATGGLEPDLTLLLTLPAEVGLKNALGRQGGDRLENEGLEFQKKVRRGFLKIAALDSRRIKIVPVQPDILETQKAVQTHIRAKLHGHRRPTPRAALSH